MLLYLSTSENETLFSEWLEGQGIFMDFIDFTRYPTLIHALGHNRAMPNYEYIMFHFTSPFETEPVLEAVSHIRRFYHARVIIFAPQCPETAGLFTALVDIGLRELVTVNEDTDLQAELQECMSRDGKGFLSSVEIAASAGIEMAQAKIRPKLSLPQGKNLILGIAGTQDRVGVTTQAFCIYHALKALGLTPCIIDRKRAFTEMLASFYSDEMVVDGSLFSIYGVSFANDLQIGTAYNAFIVDYGVLSPDTAQDFELCDIRLLCSGAKAWEFPYLIKTLQAYPNIAQQAVFSFVPQSEEKEVSLLVKNIIPASFAPWTPDIWSVESEWHERFILPLVKEAIER